MNKKLNIAYQYAKEKFIKFDGVIGIGYGTKYTGGKVVNNESIIIFVEKKLAANKIKTGQLIPTTFKGFTTDVREPKLTGKRIKFDPNKPPENIEDECLTDYNWIDYGKIHRLNMERRRKHNENEPTTQLSGNLFIIHDPKQALVQSGTINFLGAYRLFRENFGDHYDFISFYVDVASGMPDVENASNPIYNDVTGIGKDLKNEQVIWSTTKLKQRIHHTWFTSRTLLHEIGHQWLFFPNYKLTAEGTEQQMLHQDFTNPDQAWCHWGRWPDNDFSCMDYDRADWIDNGNGTFNRVRHDEGTEITYFGYNSLDLYLMGLIPYNEVQNFDIVQNPTPAINDSVRGPYTPTGGTIKIGISNIQLNEGVRNPGYLDSQRIFHMAIIIITQNTAQTSGFITNSESWRLDLTTKFRQKTHGKAMLDTSLLRNNYNELYIKDNDADIGTGRTTAPFWLSPDLWVRQNDDNGTAHQDTIRDGITSNWIYARVRNKSAVPYQNVTVNFYLANYAGTEFLYPNDWNENTLLGSATITTVPAASGGIDGEAIAKLKWTANRIPPQGGFHPCLLCEIIPMEVNPKELHHVYENKKLAQRNITMVEAPEYIHGESKSFMFGFDFRIGNNKYIKDFAKLSMYADNMPSNILLFLNAGSLVKDFESITKEHNVTIPIVINKNSLGLPHKCSDFDLKSIIKEIKKKYEIMVTNSRYKQIISKYKLEGLIPTMINNKFLLFVGDLKKASILLQLQERQIELLRIIGIMSPYKKTGMKFLYHITEENIKGIVKGGTSIQINV